MREGSGAGIPAAVASASAQQAEHGHADAFDAQTVNKRVETRVEEDQSGDVVVDKLHLECVAQPDERKHRYHERNVAKEEDGHHVEGGEGELLVANQAGLLESQSGAVIFVLETSDHQEDFHVAADDDRQARDLDEDRDDGQNLPVHAEEARHYQRDAQRPERREHEFDTRDRDQSPVTQVKHERQNAFHRDGAHRQKRRTRARPAHEVRHQAHRAVRSEVAL